MRLFPLVFLTITTCSTMVTAWDYKCSFCHWGAGALIGYNDRGHSQGEAINLVVEGCYMLGLYPREVCSGMVNNVGKRLFVILDITNVRIPYYCTDNIILLYSAQLSIKVDEKFTLAPMGVLAPGFYARLTLRSALHRPQILFFW